MDNLYNKITLNVASKDVSSLYVFEIQLCTKMSLKFINNKFNS